ncbi:MAG: class I SAM-dependent methyltransferase [Solirubrobacteraceae bacterium]
MAESFGTDPERYDRTRPRYPQELVDRIIATSPGADMLDVGCGTGIAARQFQAAGLRVLGLDIDPRMAGFAKRRGLEVEVAKFEDWDAAGRTFDAVIAGQTWHWIDQVAGAEKAAHVLRPQGRLAVFRNDPQLPRELTKAFGEVYRRVLPDLALNPHPQPNRGSTAGDTLSDKSIPGLRQAGGFGKPERWTFDWRRTYTGAEWLDGLPTSGLLNRLPHDTLQRLLEGIRTAIEATVNNSFSVHYTTAAVTATRADAAWDNV